MPSERTYYVICEDNCKFESMTKEQIIAAIAEATGATPTQIDDAFITKVKEMNSNGNFSFWIGTTAQYNAIPAAQRVENRLYIITDEDDFEELQADVESLQTSVAGIINGTTTVPNASSAVSADKSTFLRWYKNGVPDSSANRFVVRKTDNIEGNWNARLFMYDTQDNEHDSIEVNYATNAGYAQYAQGDTSGKTILQRLTELGFREGSITTATGVTATDNWVKRQGNYVIGMYEVTSTNNMASTTIGTLPDNFKPKSGFSFVTGYNDITAAVIFQTNGSIILGASSGGGIYHLNFNFGFEANPIT